MLKSGNIGPTGQRLPKPDVLLLSYTGCFTFMKWFELLREEYHCPVAMLHVPYQPDGRITPSMRDYVVKQLHDEVIPALEQVSGQALRRGPAEGTPAARRRRPRTTSSGCCSRRSTGRRRSTRTSARSITSAPSSARSAARPRPSTTTARCAPRSNERIAEGKGPVTPGRRHRARALPRRRRRAAQLDELPPVLEDVRRRGRGRRGVHLHEGRRRVRPGIPARSRTVRSRRWPSTASAATRTSGCRRASIC